MFVWFIVVMFVVNLDSTNYMNTIISYDFSDDNPILPAYGLGRVSNGSTDVSQLYYTYFLYCNICP